jgi:hypothetical protein
MVYTSRQGAGAGMRVPAALYYTYRVIEVHGTSIGYFSLTNYARGTSVLTT